MPFFNFFIMQSTHPVLSLFSFLVSLFFIYFLTKKDIKDFLSRILSLFCLSMAFTFFWELQISSTEGVAHKVTYIKLFYYTNFISLSLFLYFVLHFCENQFILKNKWVLGLLFLPVFLFLIIFPTNLLVSSVVVFPDKKIIVHGNIYPLFLFIFLFYFLLSITVLLSSYKLTPLTRHKTQVGYLLVGTLIGGVSQITNTLFPLFILFDYPAEGIAKILWMWFSIYALKRKKPLFLEVFLSKTVIYYLVILIAISVYILGIKQIGSYFGKMMRYSPMIIESIVLVGFAFVFKPLLDAIESIINRKLFPSLSISKNFLSDFGKSLVSHKEIDKLSSLVINTISEKFGVPKIFILLKDKKSGEFKIEKIRGVEYRDILPLLAPISSFAQKIKEQNKALSLENISPARQDKEDILSQLKILGIEIIIPLAHYHQEVGILGIGEKENGTSFSEEEIEILQTISVQFAISLENAYYFEDIKETYQILHQKEKLAALGEMSSALAHEIKNPLSNIKGSAQILKNNDMTREEQNKFINFIIEEIDRLNKLLVNFLGIAKTRPEELKSYNLSCLIDNILEQSSFEFERQNIKVNKIFPREECLVLADNNLLKQMFLNLIVNSCEAMQNTGGGTLTVRVEKIPDKVKIELADTGIGVEREKLPFIFEPFFTTKEGGSGLGLTVVQKIISNIGGEIYAESPIAIINGMEGGMRIKIILPRIMREEK